MFFHFFTLNVTFLNLTMFDPKSDPNYVSGQLLGVTEQPVAAPVGAVCEAVPGHV